MRDESEFHGCFGFAWALIRCSGCGVFGVLVVLLFGFCFLSSWDTLLCLDLDTMHHVGNPPRINIRLQCTISMTLHISIHVTICVGLKDVTDMVSQ